MQNEQKLKEIQQQNCEAMIPTGWNIYEWAEKHPDTTIAAALKRVEKIFDFTSGNGIFFGFSAGKDSTVTANLACLELHLRKLRVENNIDRHGNDGVDPLDQKWYRKRLHGMMTDAEVCWTSSNDYAKRFLARMGPEKTYDEDGKQTGGFDLIEFNWICLPLAWQSGVSFDSGILISWDPNKKDMWVQPMPSKDDLHGFDCVHIDNLNRSNPVPLSSLSEKAQKYHIDHNNVFYAGLDDLFNSKSYQNEDGSYNYNSSTIEAVSNYGRGPMLPNFKAGCHEKEEQDDYSLYFCETTGLVSSDEEIGFDVIKKRLEEEYDLKYDVWFLEPNKDGFVSTSLISLRAEESLDRRVILSQGEYTTGQYSRNQGVNVCSPVFDFTTADIWRLLSATDWDVNDIYEKMYEAGIGIGDQRVGSLLNYAAIRQVATVKALEPDLYGRINQRFSNVEFMAQFSRSSYFKISKPRDSHWDGHNHIKAGYSPEEVAALSDKYENYLKLLEIPYRREGNEFWTEDPACKGKPWFPFRKYVEAM